MNTNKSVISIFLTVCFLCFLTSCETVEKSTYRIEVGEMSVNFKSNLYLQLAVSEYVAEYNTAAASELRTEKEAKSWFDNACKDIKSKTEALELSTLEESWVVLELSDYTQAVHSNKLIFAE